jgi:hypothetical protein
VRAILNELRSPLARVTMPCDFHFVAAKGRIMVTLFVIAAIGVVIFGLFAWRYEARTGGTGGIARLLHDRLLLARLRNLATTERELERRESQPATMKENSRSGD